MFKKIALAIAGLLSISAPVLATPLNPHAYNLGSTFPSVPVDGFYMVETKSTEDLSFGASSTSQLITKEGWLTIGSDSNYPEWIEVGAIKGNVVTNWEVIPGSTDGQYAQGLFVAYNTCKNHTSAQCQADIEIREQTVTYNSSGLHSFIVRNSVDTANTWDVYIDGSRYAQLSKGTFQAQNASYIDVGLETSDTANTYVSGTEMFDFWRVDPANETNQSYGWTPILYNQLTLRSRYSEYNGANATFSYPVNHGSAFSNSNTLNFYHN